MPRGRNKTGRTRENRTKLWTPQASNLKYFEKLYRHVGRPLGYDKKGEALHIPRTFVSKNCSLRTTVRSQPRSRPGTAVSGRSRSMSARENRDWQDTVDESHRASANGVGVSNSICAKERRFVSIFHVLLATKFLNDTELVPNSWNGRVCRIVGTRHNTTLEANSEYWKVEILEEDKYKRDFTSHHGQFCFIRMRFGLRYALWMSQVVINDFLSQGKCIYELVYLDNVILFSKSAE